MSGRVNAGTGAVTVEFFSDQQVKFGARDIAVEADGTVTILNGNPGKFVLTAGSARTVEGELSPAGVEGSAREIVLGPGSYDDGNLQLTFDNMKVDAAFSKGALALDAYHLLSPSLRTVMEAKGIGTILGIDLESATIHVKDVWSLPGAGNPLDLSRREALNALARGASGELTGRVVTGDDCDSRQSGSNGPGRRRDRQAFRHIHLVSPNQLRNRFRFSGTWRRCSTRWRWQRPARTR